jgi:hypothetical protein
VPEEAAAAKTDDEIVEERRREEAIEEPTRSKCMIENVATAKPKRRLAPIKHALRYGGFGHTKCYALIKRGVIKAYRMDGRTMIDLDTVDAFHASLPEIVLGQPKQEVPSEADK